MFCVLRSLRARPWSRAAVSALIAIGAAGCSSDSSRFGDNPLFPSSSPEVTGSISPTNPATAGRVESRPLPQPTTSETPTVSAGGRGMGSYSQPSQSTAADRSGSVASKAAGNGHWSWDGGRPVTVARNETVETIARRYGVPASAIMQANGLTAPATVHPGQQLVIPRYHPSPTAGAEPAGHSAPAGQRPSPKPATSQASRPGVHVVALGDTLSKISRRYGRSIGEITKANNIQATAALKVGDRLVIPGVRTSAAKPDASPAKPATAVAQANPSPPADAPKEHTPTASVFAPVTEKHAADDSGKTADATGSLPKFRWPANGRVISAYGPNNNGQQNDGINIALPENTPVKAAEEGVVAYAGSELKGYGNLVLVRHPNGYVTAYAHAKELLVKRGDQVKRGQVIARSGQSGNVNAPQLHFEIRKGASPVDPMKFLGG
jgi:murein DD-endopeptidase MepM/ murein hydrolase activator NlpD